MVSGGGFEDLFLDGVEAKDRGTPHRAYDSGRGYGYRPEGGRRGFRAEDVAILLEAAWLVRWPFGAAGRIETTRGTALNGHGQGDHAFQRPDFGKDFRYDGPDADDARERTQRAGLCEPPLPDVPLQPFGHYDGTDAEGRAIPDPKPGVGPTRELLFSLLMLAESLGSPEREIPDDQLHMFGTRLVHGKKPSSSGAVQNDGDTRWSAGAKYDRDYMASRVAAPVLPEELSARAWEGVERGDGKRRWPLDGEIPDAIHEALCGRSFHAVVDATLSVERGAPSTNHDFVSTRWRVAGPWSGPDGEGRYRATVERTIAPSTYEGTVDTADELTHGVSSGGYTSGTAVSYIREDDPSEWEDIEDADGYTGVMLEETVEGGLVATATLRDIPKCVEIRSAECRFGTEATGQSEGTRPYGAVGTGASVEASVSAEPSEDGLTNTFTITADVSSAARPSARVGDTGYSVDGDLKSVDTCQAIHFVVEYRINL